MDRATTCAAVSSSFAITRPTPHSQAEFALYFYPLAFVLVILNLVPFLAFLGPFQSRAGQPDTPLFAVAEIFAVSVDISTKAPEHRSKLQCLGTLVNDSMLCFSQFVESLSKTVVILHRHILRH